MWRKWDFNSVTTVLRERFIVGRSLSGKLNGSEIVILWSVLTKLLRFVPANMSDNVTAFGILYADFCLDRRNSSDLRRFFRLLLELIRSYTGTKIRLFSPFEK